MTALREVQTLKTHYRLGGWLSRRRVLRAVDGVDLTLKSQQTLAVVGESGSGKTTLGRTILRLGDPTAGGGFLAGPGNFLPPRPPPAPPAARCRSSFSPPTLPSTRASASAGSSPNRSGSTASPAITAGRLASSWGAWDCLRRQRTTIPTSSPAASARA